MCKKKTEKKYLTRKSPPYSAMECKGKTLEGKDGPYTSIPDKNNIYRWKSKKMRKYVTEHNGAKPYQVHDYGTKVDIYSRDHKISVPYKKIFTGTASKFPGYTFKKGNTILLMLKPGKYMFIGGSIFEFETTDVIEKYYSPIGNSNVPYPYAVGQKNTYFLLEKKYVENDKINLKHDVYSQLYGFNTPKLPSTALKHLTRF
jgi:hypothetical protein